MHPLARPGTKDTINGLKPGDRVILDDGQRGVIDQAINMGAQAYLTLDSGECVIRDNGQIKPEPTS